ncbi:MAG: family transcriptional regulator, cyclic receptor protein [Solirubrobacteraceae bacterium]|nr:family transcriptional regulator, cyclic receptor protein [Solirubrobacteraceae bacterium]
MAHRSLIPLLRADPELAEGMSPAEHDAAARVVGLHGRVLDPGPWDPCAEEWPVAPTLGLLILEGVITRDILFAGRTTTELIGTGDVMRPDEDDVQFEPLPFAVTWHVHQPTRLGLLDARFALAAARWPPLAVAISRRHVRRTRALAFQLAIAQLPRVDDRLLVLLWALAERWGRVSPRGVRLALALPHRTLATLVGARRPSVTTALSGLARDGLVERTDEGWLLHGDPSEVFAERLHIAPQALPPAMPAPAVSVGASNGGAAAL